MLKWKRFRLPWIVLFTNLAGVCCCLLTKHLLAKYYRSGNVLSTTDLFWFFFGRLPADWNGRFDLVHFFFQLLPPIVVTYFVTSYICTSLLELRHDCLLRFGSMKQWLLRGTKEVLICAELVLALFHGFFLLSAFFIEKTGTGIPKSIFTSASSYQIVLLWAKQAAVIAAISLLQMMLSLRENMQTGTIFALILYSVIVLADSFGIHSCRLMLAMSCGTDIVCSMLLLIGCVLTLVASCNRRKEKYYG